jgi:glycosyltransferase involved in cell wall biosynthesis
MRIGMILDNEFDGDTRVQNEVLSLTKYGFKVYILCFNHGKKKKLEDFNGATIVRFFFPQVLKNKLRFFNNTFLDAYSYVWSFKIRQFIKEYKISVLHSHDLYMAKSVIVANRKFNLKTILDLHENFPAALKSYTWTKSWLGKLLINPDRWIIKEKKLLKKFSKIILISNEFKEVLKNKYPNLEDKFVVYPNYPNVEKLMDFKIDTNIIPKKDEFIIFYFGGIAERRGIFTLLESLKILLKTSYLFKVLLIGPVDKSDKQKLNSFLKDKAIRNNIIYYSWRDISFLPSYIHVSDVCVSPLIKNDQHESGVANKVFQYMLFKKPIIVSNCIPQQKIVEEEKCGLVFDSGNPKDLAEKILILYKNLPLREEMGENGRKAVLAKYNLNLANKDLVNMYNNLDYE